MIEAVDGGPESLLLGNGMGGRGQRLAGGGAPGGGLAARWVNLSVGSHECLGAEVLTDCGGGLRYDPSHKFPDRLNRSRPTRTSLGSEPVAGSAKARSRAKLHEAEHCFVCGPMAGHDLLRTFASHFDCLEPLRWATPLLDKGRLTPLMITVQGNLVGIEFWDWSRAYDSSQRSLTRIIRDKLARASDVSKR
jgi:hypothetical protein